MSSIDGETLDRAAQTDPTLEYEAEGETYTIRRFREGDIQDFLDLHARLDSLRLGGSREWFDWKFAENPYLAHTPVFVAEHDGEMVGARPYMAFKLRAGPRTAIGLQTADTMVHPDHRRRGLFSRMNDLAFGYYRHREPELMFSVPNARSRPGYLDLGARKVGPVPAYHRLETPSRFLSDTGGSWVPSQTGRVLDRLASGYLGLRDRRTNGRSSEQISVERHATVPAETLAKLGGWRVPEEIHAARDERFYDWRYENPTWEYTTFVATREGEPFAAMITGRRDDETGSVTRIVDAVPLAGDARRPGFAAILSRIVEFHGESDVLVCAGSAIPDRLLRRFGFHPDDGLPLSVVSNQTVFITMPLQAVDTTADWSIEGRDISDPDNWQLPFCEQNTG